MTKRWGFAVVFLLLIVGVLAFFGGVKRGYLDGWHDGWEDRKNVDEQLSAETAERVEPVSLAYTVTEDACGKESEKSVQIATPSCGTVRNETTGKGRSNGDSLPPDEDAKTEKRYLSEDDVYCLAAAIYQEAGGDCCSDSTRIMVADVILNRVADDRYPDTIRGVLEDAPGGALQYGRFALTGVCFPEKAETEAEKDAVKRAWFTAYEIAAGEHSELYGAGYIFQAEFEQGSDCIWKDGICFAKG